MNILVTGGAGYIGSITIEKLIKLGFNVFCIDDLSGGKLEAVESTCKFYRGDFGDKSLLDKIFSNNKIDTVFHFAGEANVPDSVINPIKYYSANIVGSINLLNKMIEYGVENIIFSSSAAVYGNPIYSPIDEAHPVIPINPYGRTKLIFEDILQDYANAYSLNHISFRYFCAAGATTLHGESRENETHLIPAVIDHIIGDKSEISVFGSDYETIDGSGVRDYVHVIDIVDAHIMVMKKINECSGKQYNIGTESGYSVLEVIQAAEDIFSTKANIKIRERRAGDPTALVATCKLLDNDFSWRPRRTLKEMLVSAYNWRVDPLY